MLGRLFKNLFRYKSVVSSGSLSIDTEQDLYHRFPELEKLEHIMNNNLSLLIESYVDYVTNVSHPVWALSHLSATLCRSLCLLLQPEKILDLGSGFSSYVFRSYAKDADQACLVHTVDDNVEWLEKTREYLSQNNIDTDNLFLWSEFQTRPIDSYDLVLHDMGKMDVRADVLKNILGYAGDSGIVLLDDLHKQDYLERANKDCQETGFKIAHLKDLTTDQYDRYTGIAFHN